MTRKILLTGGSGLLAVNWAFYYKNEFDIYLCLHRRLISITNTTSLNIKIDDENQIFEALKTIDPDIIINAASQTNIELCEENAENAFNINGMLPGVLAKVAKQLSIPFVHISTDHLFDGKKQFMAEEEETSPLNVYGQSKLLGEFEVKRNNPNALIVRTNFFGWGTSYRSSFSDMIIGQLRKRKQIILFDDVYFTPIILSRLAEIIMSLVRGGLTGTFNVAGSSRVSKYDFGIMIADKFDLDKALICPGKIVSQGHLVKRPLEMSLSIEKIRTLSNLNIGNLEDYIEDLYAQEKMGMAEALQKL